MSVVIRHLSLCFLFMIMPVQPVLSFSEETIQLNVQPLDLSDYIYDYVDLPEDALDWKILGQTKQNEVTIPSDEGYDITYSKPEFTPQVKALDGKNIIIKGYMFPLDHAEMQSKFLFGPFPMGCPFHYHVGPSLVIEAHTESKPILFDYEPITIEGKLELVYDDWENNVFYRLQNTRLIK